MELSPQIEVADHSINLPPGLFMQPHNLSIKGFPALSFADDELEKEFQLMVFQSSARTTVCAAATFAVVHVACAIQMQDVTFLAVAAAFASMGVVRLKVSAYSEQSEAMGLFSRWYGTLFSIGHIGTAWFLWRLPECHETTRTTLHCIYLVLATYKSLEALAGICYEAHRAWAATFVPCCVSAAVTCGSSAGLQALASALFGALIGQLLLHSFRGGFMLLKRQAGAAKTAAEQTINTALQTIQQLEKEQAELQARYRADQLLAQATAATSTASSPAADGRVRARRQEQQWIDSDRLDTLSREEMNALVHPFFAFEGPASMCATTMISALESILKSGRRRAEAIRLVDLLLGAATMAGARRFRIEVVAFKTSGVVDAAPSTQAEKLQVLRQVLDRTRSAVAQWAMARGQLMTATGFRHTSSTFR